MIVSPDQLSRLDGTCLRIAREIEKLTDIPIVPLTRIENFEFNPDLLGVDKYILLDFSELGWDWDMKQSHLFGVNTADFSHLFSGGEWSRFDDFVARKPPLLTFQREILTRDIKQGIFPISYPCWHDVQPPETKEQFESRQLDVFYSWGLSHEGRKRVQGEIWIQSGKYGYIPCDNPYHLEGFLKNESNPHRWLAINMPHYYRQPIEKIIEINGVAKISISLAGAGRVCFRHTESPVNSIMYMWEDEIAWPYPWEHNKNCIKSEEGKEIETIIEALNNPLLYDIYLAGTEQCRKYQLHNYMANYISPIIKSL